MVAISCKTCRYGNKTFGAGKCVVYLFGGAVEGIAVIAGKEKYISNPDDVRRWLIERGLPEQQTDELLNEARGVV